MSKPLLSIGIIFKNEIRCLERCLKSLQPLRDAIPCELVMADTGADDGSREIAEQYADILIDFEWINDFAAARNAVMDRCSGKWFLSIDCDEWFDENVSTLIGFLRNNKRKENYAAFTIRNYDSFEQDHSYTDFVAIRMVRMSIGQRYVGAIHEHWVVSGTIDVFFLSKITLHHDGYVVLNEAGGEAKRLRNLTLLREELKKDPDNLMTLLQYIESGKPEADYLDTIRHAKALIDEKAPRWSILGPPILRYAVEAAYNHDFPEFEEWVQSAQEMFPNSYYIRVDIEYLAFGYSLGKKDYEACIRCGKRYLKAVEDYNKDRLNDLNARMYSVVKVASLYWVQQIKILLGVAYVNQGQPEQVPKLLKDLKWSILDKQQTENLVKLLATMQSITLADTSDLMSKVWAGLTAAEPSQQKADERKAVLVNFVGTLFLPQYRTEEKAKSEFRRHAYTVLLPLEKQFELGRSAAVLESTDPQLLTEKLGEVEHWDEFSIHAFAHALACGASFPPAGKPLNLEEMDALAGRLSKNQDVILSLALQAAGKNFADSWGSLVWVRSLVLAAVRVCTWPEIKAAVSAGTERVEVPVSGTNLAQKFELARAFAAVERRFISRCYTPETLREEAIFALPSMHRFGWYCARAFEQLDCGSAADYVSLLRSGLESCRDMKPMVEFLLEHTPELQARLKPSAELLALAEQIRGVLSNFAPDDPAVKALKQSQVYQKVAPLIEGTPAAAWGGVTQ